MCNSFGYFYSFCFVDFMKNSLLQSELRLHLIVLVPENNSEEVNEWHYFYMKQCIRLIFHKLYKLCA